MIIDAHQHFWDLSRQDYGWLTPASGVLYRNYLPQDLAGTLRDNGVAATVLVQAAASEEETRYLLKLAQAHPFIAGVVGWVDFESPDAPRHIAALVAAYGSQLKGLRPMIQDIADTQWASRTSLDDAFGAMVDHDLVFDALVKPVHLDALHTRLLRHPRLRAVLDHAGKPDIAAGRFAPWAADLLRLARDTTICCKLSGLLTEAQGKNSLEDLAPWVAHVFACFGPERVLWGSDWPVLNSAAGYAEWLDLSAQLVRRYAAGSIDEVMAGTARRTYRLQLKEEAV
jgi:L-fuconolactonase